MRGFKKAIPLGLMAAMALATVSQQTLAQGQGQQGQGQSEPSAQNGISPEGAAVGAAPSAKALQGAGGGAPATAPTDLTSLGKSLLNAGPDPRVKMDGLSREHAAIFGTEDENEQALMDQERALQVQRDQLHMLERLLTGTPASAHPPPPAMIPLNGSRAPMNMQPLAPTPSGSQIDRGNSETQRSIDEMQRRVNGLRRDADTLRQNGR
ncbi:hypothetical protein RAS12_22135 [Achromobacter seleniivolatilans]|uniref:Uncharacterized protein n=1 Tax=Achromobacter seleniivolatilans TaxID=3047478 RepID=A0ABY9LWZ0_9BURK|nr:hypothetical protein [Achromobacter sp. R39]WMD19299.1 hypothetical protein RAS12_22135 [Achromobacter sp. R39]